MPAKKSAVPSGNAKDPVMDVSKPGQSEPSANSRPIIVTRKPIMQDPMVKTGPASEVPGPPVLDSKPSRLHKFLSPKQAAGSVAADGEISNDQASEEPTVEQKIAEAKVKVDEAGAQTIEEEKPAELKTTDTTAEGPAEDKDPAPKTENAAKPATSGMPAAVKEMLEPEDVHISGTANNEEPAETAPAAKPEVSGKKVITPTKEVTKKSASAEKLEIKDMNDAPSEETVKALEEATTEKDKENAVKNPADDEAETTPDETEAAEKNDKEDPNSEQKSGGLVDELAKQAADKKSKDKEEKERTDKQQKIDKLAEDKTYFLPIGEVTRKRKNRASLAIFLVILLLLAGAYAAADAGFVKSPVKLPVDLISDKPETSESNSESAPAEVKVPVKSYTDSTVSFTIEYPETWQLVENNALINGRQPDRANIPSFTLTPPNEMEKIKLSVGGFKKSPSTAQQAFENKTKANEVANRMKLDNAVTTQEKINGYDVVYTKSDYVAPSNLGNIAYTGHTYEIFGPTGANATFIFTEKYSNESNEKQNPGKVNFDATKYLDEVKAIINSIKFK